MKVVKIIRRNEVTSPISKEDRAIASLKSLVEDIAKQIHALEGQIAVARERSQKAVELKNRSSALAALRSKKAAESVLSQRTDTLFQLEQILTQIQNASDQIDVVRVMKHSTEVLRGLNAKVGNAQDVENALDSLKEEMGKVEDISTVISEAGREVHVADENEIDEELDALLRQKERAEEQRATEITKQRLADIENVDNLEPSRAQQLMLSKDEGLTTPKAASESTSSQELDSLKHMSLHEGKASSPDLGRPSHSRNESDKPMVEA